jgi:hypothetical protein
VKRLALGLAAVAVVGVSMAELFSSTQRPDPEHTTPTPPPRSFDARSDPARTPAAIGATPDPGASRTEPGRPEEVARISEDANVRAAAATAVVDLYAGWSESRARALFVGPPLDGLEEQLEYYRAQLGTCASPQLWHTGAKRSRFVSQCERGLLELAPVVDEDGHIRALRHGAQGVDPGAAVQRAAEAAMRLWQEWDDTLFRETFAESWDPDVIRDLFTRATERWGVCRFGGVDLANARGALFELECDEGDRLMKLDLTQDDRIRRFALFRERPNKPWVEP